MLDQCISISFSTPYKYDKVHDRYVHFLYVYDLHMYDLHVHDLYVYDMYVHDWYVHVLYVHNLYMYDLYVFKRIKIKKINTIKRLFSRFLNRDYFIKKSHMHYLDYYTMVMMLSFHTKHTTDK